VILLVTILLLLPLPLHITIAIVSNTLPTVDIDHVSVAGIATYNAAASSMNAKQKIIIVFWATELAANPK